MSDQNNLVWHINISHLNRYLLIDVLRALGVAVGFLIIVQILPIGSSATTLTTAIIAGIIFWGIALTVKLFTSFSGHSIRFILDDEGATAFADEGKLGGNYVEKRVSSISDVNLHSDKTHLHWSQVSGLEIDKVQKIISLKRNDHSSLQLFCYAENFNTVLDIVNTKCSPKQLATK